MVLNGKAEIVSRTTQAPKIRNEREELIVLVGLTTGCLLLSWQLYSTMGDGWQLHARTRGHVLLLAGSLLTLSTATCCYLCRRLTASPSPTPPRTLTSVNSQLQLVCGDRPPSYESVLSRDAVPPPPSYSAVFTV